MSITVSSWPPTTTNQQNDFLAALDASIPAGATLNSVLGTVAFDRLIKTSVQALSGATMHAATNGITAWVNPEAGAIIILRVVLDLTTVATGACTLDVGLTATNATTTSDTLLDGIDVNAAVALFDSMNAALDSGTNAFAQKLAAGKWITFDEKTGDATGLVANAYIQYLVV